MSFLCYLLEDNYDPDADLFEASKDCLENGISDTELVNDVEIVEENSAGHWTDISDSQVVCEAVEIEQNHDEFNCEITDEQCVRAAEHVESMIRVHPRRLGKYEGPAVPMPTLRNNVVIVAEPRETDQPNFDLGYHVNSDSDNELSHKSHPVFKVPDVPTSSQKKHQREKVQCVFKQPRSDDDMKKMGQKKFAEETYKKMRWVVNMYHSWHITHNRNPDAVPIKADLDNPVTLEKKMLCYALCRFITKIKKLNGEDYPPKTIYKMLVCIQMHLETQGMFWKLLNDKEENFIQLRYMCDNLMKES